MDKAGFIARFREIIDPNTGRDIVELGAITGVDVHEDTKRVYVMMHMPHHLRDLQGYVESSVIEEVSSAGYKPIIELMARKN